MPARSRGEDIGISIDLLTKRPARPDGNHAVSLVLEDFASAAILPLMGGVVWAVDEYANTGYRAAPVIEIGLEEGVGGWGALSEIRKAQLSLVERWSSRARVTSTMKYAARHAFRPEIGLVGSAHDRDDNPVRAQHVAGAFERVAADGVDDCVHGLGGQLQADAVGFHDGLGTQGPHAIDVPGARSPVAR